MTIQTSRQTLVHLEDELVDGELGSSIDARSALSRVRGDRRHHAHAQQVCNDIRPGVQRDSLLHDDACRSLLWISARYVARAYHGNSPRPSKEAESAR